MSKTFASLAYPNYRKWFFGGLIANIGTWMLRITQTWVVLTELSADSGTAVGIVIALQFGPTLLLTPLGGVAADRVNRVRLLLLTNTLMSLSAIALGALLLSGNAELWHVYIVAAFLGTVAAFDQPVRMTFVSELVPPSSLANAVGLNATSFNAARLIGPAVAGLLIAAAGSGWVFVITGIAFVGPMISMVLIKQADMYTQKRRAHTERGMRPALRYVRQRPDIAVIMAVMAVTGAFGLNFQVFVSTMARDAYERGASDYGILNTFMGIGALAGALLAARRARPRTRLVVGAAAVFGILEIISAFMPTYQTYGLALIPLGFAATTMMNTANSTIQLATTPEIRGRVMSLYIMVFFGSTPIASPFIGWLASEFGARAAVAFGGTVSLLAALVAMAWGWKVLGVRVKYSFHPVSVRVINPHAAPPKRIIEESSGPRGEAPEAQQAPGEASAAEDINEDDSDPGSTPPPRNQSNE